MKESKRPYDYLQVLFGTEPEVVPASGQHLNTTIVITGVDLGIVTIEAKEVSSDEFEKVAGGKINLAYSKTVNIRGYNIKELRFTSSIKQAYTVRVKQYG